MICSTCKLDISTVGEVRGCSVCQRNGTSGAVHAKFANADPIEKMVDEANPGAFPFEPAPSPDAAEMAQSDSSADAAESPDKAADASSA